MVFENDLKVLKAVGATRFLKTPETLELATLFHRISDPGMRRALMDLIETCVTITGRVRTGLLAVIPPWSYEVLR